VQGATALTYGITNRVLVRPRPQPDQSTTTTREYLSVSIQQTYYDEPQASQFDFTYVSASHLTGLEHYSPVSISMRALPIEHASATSRLEYDVSTGTPVSFGVQGSVGPIRGLNVSANLSRTLRQRLATGVKVYDSIVRIGGQLSAGATRGSYSVTRDLSRGYNVQQSIGWSYNAQCCGLAIDYQAYNYPELAGLFPVSADRRINVSFMLAGLGTFQNLFGAFGGTR